MLKDTIVESEDFVAEPIQKGIRPVPMGIVDTGNFVRTIYQGAQPFAFVRELVQNALDAGADRVEIGPSWAHVKASGATDKPVYKLAFSDNGHGIKRTQMAHQLNNLAASLRVMGPDGNYGIGAKVTCLPWNPHGMIVMSWTGEKDDGTMIRLIEDKQTRNYGMHRYAVDDGFDELPTPPSGHRSSWQTSGTSVVLLGESVEEDTIFGPPSYEAGLYSIIHVVNDRYFTFPETVSVKVCVFESVTKSKWPKTRSGASYRRAEGSRYYLDKHSKESGTVNGQGCKIHWWWHPDVNMSGFDSYTSPLGYVSALHNTELYDTFRRGAKKTTPHGLISAMAKFGILPVGDVWKNVTIVVEPDKDKVYTDLARGQLRYKEGGSLPWDEWGQMFAAKMPKVIADALDKASHKEDVEDEEAFVTKIKEYIDRMGLFADNAPKPSSNQYPKRKAAKTTTGAGGSSKGKTTAGADGEKKASKYDLPDVAWVSPSKEPAYASLLKGKPVYYNEGARSVLIDEDFPLWKKMTDHWVSKFPNAPGVVTKVRQAVRYVAKSQIVTRIIHLRMFRGKPDWNAHDYETALSNEALTMTVLGIQDADTRIANYLKGTLRMKRLKEALETIED